MYRQREIFGIADRLTLASTLLHAALLALLFAALADGARRTLAQERGVASQPAVAAAGQAVAVQ